MPLRVSPKEMQENVQRGFDRLANFRNARLMFLRQYVGAYYDRCKGETGREPLNLIFNAIRTLVPHIVMNYPKNTVRSQYLAHLDYARLMELALDFYAKTTDLKSVYRQAIVDSIFTLGIIKVGLAESDSVYVLDEYTEIDTGQIYTECVDFDNFVVDPHSKDHLFRDALYMGDRICMPRQQLLDSGLYKNELIEQLPSLYEENRKDRASDLSQRNIKGSDYELEDEVELVELWVPSANALVTVPGAKDVTFDDFLRVDDYYGPDTGPYTLLALTPPVPGNPLPIPAVGIWHDLHMRANEMANKIIDQATRQKDVTVYRRSSADDAQELRDASDGESVATDDPDSVRVLSFGGQQQSNEVMLAQLSGWFNQMAANPQVMGGSNMDADSATEASIMQSNSHIGLEDMTDLVYQMAARVARNQAWYLHTDPFIDLPLIRRDQISAQYAMTQQGPMMIKAPEMIDQQVHLTPEARRGDWIDFSFDIRTESMGKMDSRRRLQIALDFAVKLLPSVFQAALTANQLGMPFNAKQFLVNMANDAGIDWMDQVFFDPDFQARYMAQMLAGPAQQGSQGQPGGGEGGPPQIPGMDMMKALMQNGQPGQVMGSQPSEQMQFNQQTQEGANSAQADLRGMGGII